MEWHEASSNYLNLVTSVQSGYYYYTDTFPSYEIFVYRKKENSSYQDEWNIKLLQNRYALLNSITVYLSKDISKSVNSLKDFADKHYKNLTEKVKT